MFVPGKPVQLSHMFAGKAGAYPSESPFRLLAHDQKSFMKLAPGEQKAKYLGGILAYCWKKTKRDYFFFRKKNEKRGAKEF